MDHITSETRLRALAARCRALADTSTDLGAAEAWRDMALDLEAIMALIGTAPISPSTPTRPRL